MKKISFICTGILIIFFISIGNLNAWDEGVILSFNSGIYTDDSLSFSPFYWTYGMNLDIHFAKFLMISPEFYNIIHNFEFGQSTLAPGALLNFKLNGFFAGGGISKQWHLGTNGTSSSDLLFKFNAGFRGEGLRLVVFLVTGSGSKNILKNNHVGATIGFEWY